MGANINKYWSISADKKKQEIILTIFSRFIHFTSGMSLAAGSITVNLIIIHIPLSVIICFAVVHAFALFRTAGNLPDLSSVKTEYSLDGYTGKTV